MTESALAEPGIPGDCLPINFAEHAVRRFIERLRPGIESEAAYSELCHLLASSRVVRQPPGWLATESAPPADRWLLIGDDLALPLRRNRAGELLAVTTLARGSISPTRRSSRNRARASQRAGKRAGKLAVRGPVRRAGPTAEEFDR